MTVADDLDGVPDELLRPLAGVELSLPVRGSFTSLPIDLPQLLLNAFHSGLIKEVKSRYTSSSGAQPDMVKDRIATEKEALRQRLETEQQQAAEIVRVSKQQVEQSKEAARQALELKREQDKNALKDKLQNNLKNNLSEILGEN